tara:strand:+ start:16959 stop:21560 length:4602 start_codon:yes stop_codon:yes gene_type:complete
MTFSKTYQGALDMMRNAMNDLHHSGEVGFEGLLAEILADSLKLPVRLASSGYQFGHDAVALTPDMILSIEAKRYKSPIDQDSILSKLTQLQAKASIPDLWLLGATDLIKSQIAEQVETVADQNGIAVEILDWPQTSSAPPLAAYLLLAPGPAARFLAANMKSSLPEATLRNALSTLEQHADICSMRDELQRRLSAPSIGMTKAREANQAWLDACFRSRSRAAAEFGQKLAPFEMQSMPLRERPDLVQKIAGHVFTAKPGKPVYITGSEGNGKSWATVQAWQKAAAPLMILITANDASRLLAAPQEDDILADMFARQTGGRFQQRSRRRWNRKIDRWKAAPDTDRPRFVLFVDGINQRCDLDWRHVLNRLALFCEDCGGQLCVTIRPALYNRERLRFPEAGKRIEVGEWTGADLMEIFSAEGVDAVTLPDAVTKTLRNPRLCGIAFELRARGLISDFAELTTSRLLFEQIYAAEDTGLPRDEFLKSLELHARDIVQRAQGQASFDFEFDSLPENHENLLTRLDIISQDGFFSAILSDPTRYEIRMESLTLGLAIGLIRQIEQASRRGDDAGQAYDRAIESISALDLTSAIVLDALLLSAADEACSACVTETLVAGYIRLQNIDTDVYPAFAAVARLRQAAFLNVLEAESATPRSAFNHDWLLDAIANLTTDPESEPLIRAKLEHWLTRYSLAPKLSANRKGNPTDTTEDELETRTELLRQKIDDLSAAERSMLDSGMHRDDTLVSYALHEDSLLLFRRLSLAPSVPAFARYALAAHLNSPVFHTTSDLQDLIRYNQRDWANTRAAILHETDLLQADGPSRTALWAVISLLEATGDSGDASLADTLRERLIPDEHKRLVRRFNTGRGPQPADPEASLSDEQLDDIIARLNGLDLANWRRGRDNTSESHDIEKNLPLLARHAPQAALAFQRKLNDAALSRTSGSLKYAVFGLAAEASSLTDAQRDQFIAKGIEEAETWSEPEDRETWATVQYSLLLGLRGARPQAQLEALSSLPGNMPLMVELNNILGSADPDAVESSLEGAIQTGGENRIVSMLRFVARTGPHMTVGTLGRCEQLRGHDSTSVRAFAIAAIIRSGSSSALNRFVKSGWTANALDRKQAHFERWYGSIALIEAHAGLATLPAGLAARLVPDTYAYAVNMLDVSIVTQVSDLVDVALRMRLTIEEDTEPPVILRDNKDPADSQPDFVTVEDRRPHKKLQNPLDAWREMSESDDEFRARQEARSNAFKAFTETLTKQGAEAFLADIGATTIRACHTSAPDRVSAWGQRILETSGWDRRAVKNIGLRIASEVSQTTPELARALLHFLARADGIITLQTGQSKASFESVTVWKAAFGEDMVRDCHRRLDRCAHDGDLFREIVAALIAGREDLLCDYVGSNTANGTPFALARSLIVTGFALDDDRLITRHETDPGMIGAAARFARNARNTNQWAKTSWHAMQTAGTPEVFWQHSMTFRSCVDGRFDAWKHLPKVGPVAERFNSSLAAGIARAMRDAQTRYARTYLGSRPPNAWFVTGAIDD